MPDATLHLLRRATFGPTPASIAQARSLGRNAWLEQQLRPASIKDPVVDKVLTRFPDLRLTPDAIRVKYAGEFGTWTPMTQLTQATVARAIWSERQLFEVMVEFWSNHLNVASPSSEAWDNRPDYDRVIRAHALGRFDDLLVAAITHPSMLTYLDNASSTKEHPNENLGRELMELHTVGVDAGYGEDGVRDSARILTGLGTDWKTGLLTYRANWHWTGRVRVLDFEDDNATAAGGRAVAERYLRYLAHHPATATRIATKLAVRFVSDTPPPALVKALAATYLAGGTAIAPVLRKLFRSSDFYAAADAKVRRPFEDLAATVRTLGLGPDASGVKGIQALGWIAGDLGQAPMAWAPPNGYPDVAPAWQSAAGTLARWNMHTNLAARWWPKELTGGNVRALLPKTLPKTHGALIDALAQRLLQRSLTAGQRTAICDFLTTQWATITPAAPVTAKSDIVGWRLPYVVALILDTPQHALR